MSAVLFLLVAIGQPATEPPELPDAISGATTSDVPSELKSGPLPATEVSAEPAVTLAPTAVSETPPPAPSLPLALVVSLNGEPTPADGVPRALGPVVEGRWLAPAPLFLSAALGVNSSWSANDSWQFSRTGLSLVGTVGLAATRGDGRMFASLSLGAEAIFERKSRQGATGLDDTAQGRARWRYTVGPHAAAEVGAGITFWAPIGVEVGLGPSLSLQQVDGQRRTMVGVHSRVGLNYAF
jgi:hypothetical protein